MTSLLSLAGHRLKVRRSVELILEHLPFHDDDAAAAAGMTPDELAHSVMTAISDHLNWQSTSTVAQRYRRSTTRNTGENSQVTRAHLEFLGGIKRYRDPSVLLSVPRRICHRRAPALGYRHAGCLQLSHVRTADQSADGRRSAACRTAVGGGHIVSPPRGDNLFTRLFLLAAGRHWPDELERGQGTSASERHDATARRRRQLRSPRRRKNHFRFRSGPRDHDVTAPMRRGRRRMRKRQRRRCRGVEISATACRVQGRDDVIERRDCDVINMADGRRTRLRAFTGVALLFQPTLIQHRRRNVIASLRRLTT